MELCHTGLWHLTEPKAAALSDPAAGNMACFSQAELRGTTQFTEGFNGGKDCVLPTTPPPVPEDQGNRSGARKEPNKLKTKCFGQGAVL